MRRLNRRGPPEYVPDEEKAARDAFEEKLRKAGKKPPYDVPKASGAGAEKKDGRGNGKAGNGAKKTAGQKDAEKESLQQKFQRGELSKEQIEKFSKYPCRFAKKGTCTFGNKCLYSHSKTGTKDLADTSSQSTLQDTNDDDLVDDEMQSEGGESDSAMAGAFWR